MPTIDERREAVRALTTEWPYLKASELYDADGDSPENIAVNLQMQKTELLRALKEIVESQPKFSTPARIASAAIANAEGR
jgi:hypothetical protein